MNTVYFFSSEDEYQSIITLITSFTILQKEPKHFVYVSSIVNQYVFYENIKELPRTIGRLRALNLRPIYLVPHEVRPHFVALKKKIDAYSDLRLCCHATLAQPPADVVSSYVARVVKVIEPDSLLILTTDANHEDVAAYLARNKTKRSYQLPRIEMTATALNVALLQQQPIPNLRQWEHRIRIPASLATPFIHKGKTLTVYISDMFGDAEKLARAGSSGEPYITVYYDESDDVYVLTRFNFYELNEVANEINAELGDFLRQINSIRSDYNLALTRLNLCCPAHLGAKYGSSVHADANQPRVLCVTDVLYGLVKALKPTSLLLLTKNSDDAQDAERYLSRQPTALGYRLPPVPMKGMHVSRLDNDAFLRGVGEPDVFAVRMGDSSMIPELDDDVSSLNMARPERVRYASRPRGCLAWLFGAQRATVNGLASSNDVISQCKSPRRRRFFTEDSSSVVVPQNIKRVNFKKTVCSYSYAQDSLPNESPDEETMPLKMHTQSTRPARTGMR